MNSPAGVLQLSGWTEPKLLRERNGRLKSKKKKKRKEKKGTEDHRLSDPPIFPCEKNPNPRGRKVWRDIRVETRRGERAMSLGYAEKLSYREDVGTVGMSEIFDPPDVLQQKVVV